MSNPNPSSSSSPSSRRARSRGGGGDQQGAAAVWPDHFVEGVATRIAIDAAHSHGRLAAAPAIATVFQVCSTWRSISQSELLWEEVTRRVWSHHHSLLPLWRDEFCRLHRTALNFRFRRTTHSHILPPSSDVAISCRRLALSDSYLAAGFSDGTVRLFHLPTGQHLASFGPHSHRTRLGLYSHSISGMVFLSDYSTGTTDRLMFACQDGDVHAASLNGTGPAGVRRVNVGNPVDNGPLIDFTCDRRWWVGLFAGVPGRSWHVWDGMTEQLVYVGGSLMDPDSVVGWRMLTELAWPSLGRVRIPEQGVAVGCTGSRIQVIDLEGDGGGGGGGGDDDDYDEMGNLVRHLEFQQGAILVDSFDGCEGQVMVVNDEQQRWWHRMIATVRTARNLEVVCRFSINSSGGGGSSNSGRTGAGGGVGENEGVNVVGCINCWGYAAVACSDGGGEIRMWDVMRGEYLYRFRERIGETSVIVASSRYVSAWSPDTGLHVWDFGAHV